MAPSDLQVSGWARFHVVNELLFFGTKYEHLASLQLYWAIKLVDASSQHVHAHVAVQPSNKSMTSPLAAPGPVPGSHH